MTPKHFDGIEFRAVGGQVKQNQTSSPNPHNNVYLIILMEDVIIPSNISNFLRMLFQQGLQQFCDFLKAGMETKS